jgi:hypothetical protein
MNTVTGINTVNTEEMTEEELSRAMREYEKVRPRDAMKVSLEARLDWLEADVSAQRTAILRLERDNRWHRVGLWVFLAYFAGLSLLLAINFPRLERLP